MEAHGRGQECGGLSLLFHCAFILTPHIPNLAHGHAEVGAGRGRRAGTTTDVTCPWSLLAVLEVRGSSLCALQTIKVVVFGAPPPPPENIHVCPSPDTGWLLLFSPSASRVLQGGCSFQKPSGLFATPCPTADHRSTWAAWPGCRCGRALRALWVQPGSFPSLLSPQYHSLSHGESLCPWNSREIPCLCSPSDCEWVGVTQCADTFP